MKAVPGSNKFNYLGECNYLANNKMWVNTTLINKNMKNLEAISLRRINFQIKFYIDIFK